MNHNESYSNRTEQNKSKEWFLNKVERKTKHIWAKESQATPFLNAKQTFGISYIFAIHKKHSTLCQS